MIMIFGHKGNASFCHHLPSVAYKYYDHQVQEIHLFVDCQSCLRVQMSYIRFKHAFVIVRPQEEYEKILAEKETTNKIQKVEL